MNERRSGALFCGIQGDITSDRQSILGASLPLAAHFSLFVAHRASNDPNIINPRRSRGGSGKSGDKAGMDLNPNDVFPFLQVQRGRRGGVRVLVRRPSEDGKELEVVRFLRNRS